MARSRAISRSGGAPSAPGVTSSGLGHDISDAGTRAYMDDFRALAIPVDAIANAIAYAIGQPDAVDVSESIVRPTASAD